MKLEIYPSPVLRKIATKVDQFDDKLTQLAGEMLAFMYQSKGLGLAAPQIGLSIRLFVYNPRGNAKDNEDERIVVNPRVVKRSKMEIGEEGCLSFPGIYGEIARPSWIKVEAQNLAGEVETYELEGFTARVFLHEFDHLEGINFINRMEPADKVRIRGALEELEFEFKESRATDQ